MALNKVLVANAVSLNGGDAAILDAVVASIRAAAGENTDIVVLDRQADVSQSLYPAYRFHPGAFETCRRLGASGGLAKAAALLRMVNLLVAALVLRLTGWRWPVSEAQRTLLDHYRTSVAVVSTGGTMFVEKYRLLPKAAEIWLAYILKKPVALFTQSFEPIRKPGNRLLMRSVLRRARLVLVRGQESYDEALRLGAIPGRTVALPDAVFRFYQPPRPRASRRQPHLLVSVRYWPYARGGDAARAHYRSQIATFCTAAANELDARITFLSTCQGVPQYPVDDSAEAEEIRALCDADVRGRIEIDAGFHRPVELMRTFGAADAVIATRLHACILALCAGTVVVPIAYERKTQEVFGRLCPGETVQELETLDARTLLASVRQALDDRVKAIDSLTGPLINEAEESRRADMLLREMLARA